MMSRDPLPSGGVSRLVEIALFDLLVTARCTVRAKRGLAIACRPSVCLYVCPSVTLVAVMGTNYLLSSYNYFLTTCLKK